MERIGIAHMLALSLVMFHCMCASTTPVLDELELSRRESQARHMGWQRNNKAVLVALGDSQTMFGSNPDGWLSLLAQKYAFSTDIRNRGVAMGTTTAGKYQAISIAHTECKQVGFLDKPIDTTKLVTILYGSNDGAPVNSHDLTNRLVPIGNFTNNLHTIISTLTDSGIENILLITPPPSGLYPASIYAPYAEAVMEVGQARKVAVADFYTSIQQVDDWQNTALFRDRLHLSKLGNRVLFDTVLQALERQMPHVAPAAMIENMLTEHNMQFAKHLMPQGLIMAHTLPK